MNWRLLTTINAIIALITVGAVIFDLTRIRNGRSPTGRQQTTSQSNVANNQAGERAHQNRIESPEDLANARVDDLGSVPAVTIAELMGRLSPEQLAAMALKFNEAPTDARTFGGMGVFFQAWTELDPKAALNGAFRINDVGMRELAARTVINSVSPSAAPELIAFLAEHPDKDLADVCRNEFLGGLIANWSQLDPEAASKYVDELGDTKTDLGYRARSDIAYNWATLDPSAALEWVTNQEEKDFVDPSNLYRSVVKGWCRKDIDTASAYVAQHLDEPFAAVAASSVVSAMFDHNAEAAAVWAGNMPAGEPRSEAESTIASLWATKDPAAGAKWVATLPADEQTTVVRTIMNSWAETNWKDASRWIDTLTGDVRDEALAAAVDRQGATPADSLSTALSIAQEEMRDNAIENVIRTWAATDTNAAQTWIDGSPISAEQRDHLRSVVSDTQQAAEVDRIIITH